MVMQTVLGQPIHAKCLGLLGEHPGQENPTPTWAGSYRSLGVLISQLGL